MKAGLLFLCLVYSTSFFALDAKEVILKMQEVYVESKGLEYSCKYELFKGQNTNVETTNFGYIYRNGAEVYQKVDQVEYVYANSFFLQINREEKLLQVFNPQQNNNLNVDLDKALKECSGFEMKEEKNKYVITLTINSGSSLPFSSVELQINKKKFFLEQLDLFYSSRQDFVQESGTSDLAQPHLRITFFDIHMHTKPEKKYFSLESYVVTTSNELTPLTPYEGYSIVDHRKSS